MFGKKKEVPTREVAVETQVEPEVPVASLDEQLHEDIHTAQDALLAEAKRILETPLPHNTEKSERLRKLNEMGFTSTVDVKEQRELDNIRQQHTDMKTTIQYYNKRYPMYRFISMDAVKAVCEKYGLILTEVRDYISDIPEKNQDEIVNFSVWQNDTRKPREIIDTSWSSSSYDDDGKNEKHIIKF